MNDRDRRIFGSALSLWGKDAQLYMVIEEASELIKALCKANRRGIKKASDEIIEELVDMEIMLAQLHLILEEEVLDYKQDYEIMRGRKMKRLQGIVNEARMVYGLEHYE